jgi:hypothetical protein
MAKQREAELLTKGGEQHHKRPRSMKNPPVPTLADQGVDKDLAKLARKATALPVVIRALGKRVIGDVIEIGRALAFRWSPCL